MLADVSAGVVAGLVADLVADLVPGAADLIIRAAVPVDAAPISALMRDAIARTNAADYPPSVIARLLARHGTGSVAAMIAGRTVFVGTESGVPVGTVALEGDQMRGLFVAPDRQGRGIGSRLVRFAEAHAAGLGLTTLWLQASLTAHDLYRRHGYADECFEAREDGSVTIMRKRFETP